jgi:hypothetical protein
MPESRLNVGSMKNLPIYQIDKSLLFAALLVLSAVVPRTSKAAGVTIITHGYDGDVTGWITAMADEIPNYYHNRYPGFSTNLTIYTITLTTDGTDYYYQWARDSASPPSNTDTGEIIVKLDWSQMAGGVDPYEPYDISTYTVANVASYVLMQTNIIADLNGHALVEYPIHLIGHSRGGSLMSQISYDLGTNGIWIDHLTTLDPHPFNNDGNFDPFFPTDASASSTYDNILFADNYWQNVGALLDPDGEAVSGAYVRQLDADELSEGYNDTSSISPDHSNVHLWYHGSIGLDVPTSYNDDGTTITIDATMRKNWWVPYEDEGAVAGFYYSLIGGGNRLSTDTPLGLPGDPAIVNGYNQYWNLGAGTSVNRTVLPANNGTWPNIIRFDITGTNVVAQSNSVITTLYYQYGGSSNLTVEIYFDPDRNPCNSNGIPVLSLQPPATGTGSVYYYPGLGLPTTNVAPGVYAVYAKISDGQHTRYLYAPELVQITSLLQPPVLGFSKMNSTQFRIVVNGVSGQTIVLQNSADLQNWVPLASNTLTGISWTYTNTVMPNSGKQFFRAVVQ